MGNLLRMTNLPTKNHDCHSETFQDIERTRFLHKMLLWHWPLSYVLTSKCIGVIYCPWSIFLTSTMTVTQKLFKILSGHSFCIICYRDIDLVTSKCIGVIYWPWPIFLPSSMTLTQKLFKILSGHDMANGWTDRRTPYHNTSEVSLQAYKNVMSV